MESIVGIILEAVKRGLSVVFATVEEQGLVSRMVILHRRHDCLRRPYCENSYSAAAQGK